LKAELNAKEITVQRVKSQIEERIKELEQLEKKLNSEKSLAA
jgi:hypothetical protein